MTSIGIVGAGVGGLHLALVLRRHGIGVTLYAERPAGEVAGGRLTNTVAHLGPTLAREAELGVSHWDVREHGYGGHLTYVGGPQPLQFRGDFADPGRAVDYRIYLPQLMADAEAAGAELVPGAVGLAELEATAARHDLLVVAAGRGPLAQLFPPRPGRSRSQPFRRLTAVLLHGIAPTEPRNVVISVSPGQGEIIEIPFLTFGGMVSAVLCEGVPGGEIAALADRPYGEDPTAFTGALAAVLKAHAPLTYERAVPGEFAVTRPEDVLQGAVTPCLREDHAVLPDGRPVLAVGDAHCTMDPVVAQGANAAAHSAWVTGQAIAAGGPYDEAFCRRVAERRALHIESAYDWVEAMLSPPSPQLLAMILAQARSRAVADEFADNFAHPVEQWAHLVTIDATRTYLAGHGLDADELLAGLG